MLHALVFFFVCLKYKFLYLAIYVLNFGLVSMCTVVCVSVYTLPSLACIHSVYWISWLISGGISLATCYISLFTAIY